MAELNQRGGRLLNDIHAAPRDSLQGMVLLHPHIRILEIGNTVVRQDYAAPDTFRILAGGPSGHEPMYAGYVGRGMLGAAVQGEVFRSPSTYEVLNVIKELAHGNPWGVLLIVQNTSRCALNFALAVEKALAEGIKVKLLITADDCSEPLAPRKSDQRQGLTGTILSIKVAGAMADGFGACLDEVFAYVSELQKAMATALVVLRPCTLATEAAACRCAELHAAALGGGLRAGDGSRRKLKGVAAGHVAEEVVRELAKNVVFDPGVGVVAMVNNMCCSPLEENILAAELLRQLIALGVDVRRVYVGTFMTAVDLQGFTVTVLRCDETLLQYLDHPTEAPCWRMRTFGVDASRPTSVAPRVRVLSFPRIVPRGPSLAPRAANVLLLVMQFACDALISCRQQLDVMDAEEGDGDVGMRLEAAAGTILTGLRESHIDTANMYACFRMLSKICDTVSGSLGAIYSIMFESCANTFAEADGGDEIDENLWLQCLHNAIIALKSYTQNEDPTENMLAPLMACAATVQEQISLDGLQLLQALEAGVARAEEAAMNTATRRYPDPGAHAVGIWLRAIYEGVKFRCQF